MHLLRINSPRFNFVKTRLGYLKPTAYAKKLGLIFRKPKKITMPSLLLSYWLMTTKGKFSYQSWAMELTTLEKETVNGQSIRQRMTSDILPYIENLLKKSLLQKCDTFIDSELFKPFSEVYVQDATHFSLPKCMADVFPSSGGKGEGRSTAKIQVTLNVKKGQFSDFKLGSFRDNDQKDAPRLVSQLKKNDLIIRDLGYFKLDVFKQIEKKGSYYLSRFRPGTIVFNAKNGKRISLLKKLRRKQFLDCEVILGVEDQLKCRMIAVPVPKKIADQRRQKAMAERSQKANRSDEYLELLDYNIFITNVEANTWTLKQVIDAYKCRWYIEIIFKGWKSHLKTGKAFSKKDSNEFKVKFSLYASLLLITLIVMPLFYYLQKRVAEDGKQISILKLCEFIGSFLTSLILTKDWQSFMKYAEYHCTYDLRANKKNMVQMIYAEI